MTPRSGDDGIEVAVARIEEKVEHILERVECLPGVCETQARHDERLSALERVGKWALGVVATVLSGLGLWLFAFLREVYGHIIAGGGKP